MGGMGAISETDQNFPQWAGSSTALVRPAPSRASSSKDETPGTKDNAASEVATPGRADKANWQIKRQTLTRSVSMVAARPAKFNEEDTSLLN
jgi:hypothetical protein